MARTPTKPSGADALGAIVGGNLRRLRSRRSLSLEALARLSGVSRAMLGQIEMGRSVPTISVVQKITDALDVPFATLVQTEEEPRLQVLPKASSKLLRSASGQFSSRALFPFDGERRTEFYELRLQPGAVEPAEAHSFGTTENLVVAQGALELSVGGETRRLEAGDAALFQADEPHSYGNPGATEAVAYLVMTYTEPHR